ncbi:Retrovirus-related Pol polyprotein from transposon 297 [Araneus ventricosus]|uniref:Retrovirus-related Pol polyprotein from transposon 297 n=1 Tax=Araneus ventricosus TaxID=182803 RepID=A0A4Y2FCF9_ARAVE|nr:Retrovirus-related Pol polyprotein from transposon 297 [Araneus ventricosus]
MSTVDHDSSRECSPFEKKPSSPESAMPCKLSPIFFLTTVESLKQEQWSDKHGTIMKLPDSITIQNETLPAKIRVLSDDKLPLDVLIGIDFLQQTRFTFDKDGIRFCSDDDEYFLFHVANVIDDCPFDLSHVSDLNIRNELSSLINSYKPNKTKDIKLKMNIVLQYQIPVCQRARRLSFLEKQKVNEQITDWLNHGVIRESCSDYCSPLVLCKKKDGNLRLCIYYHKLNAKTVKDRYPLHLIEEVLDQLPSGKFFSTIDLKNGFFHVEMEEDSEKFTSFVTADGQYEFNKVPLGLCNSPSIFQRFINHVFRDLLKAGHCYYLYG